MPGQLGAGGFEPRTNPAERRDFFDLRRQITEINANIAALETLTDPSAWANVGSYETGWAAGSEPLRVRTSGDEVLLTGFFTRTGATDVSAGYNIATLDAAYRPAVDVEVVALHRNTSVGCRLIVWTTGVITIVDAVPNGDSWSATFRYPLT